MIISQAKLNFAHSVVYNYCPNSFNNMWPKNRNQNQNQNPTDARELCNTKYFLVPHPRIQLFKKSALYSIPVVWYSLDEIGFQQCKAMFRRGLKEKLLNEIQV
jgi:hypothetical protein